MWNEDTCCVSSIETYSQGLCIMSTNVSYGNYHLIAVDWVFAVIELLVLLKVSL